MSEIPVAIETTTLHFVKVGKVVARFVEPPNATGEEVQDRHRLRLWLNRVEESALRLLDEQPESAGFVLCTREYFDELRDKGTLSSGRAPSSGGSDG